MIAAHYCTCMHEWEYSSLHSNIQCHISSCLARSYVPMQEYWSMLKLLQGTKISENCCGGSYAAKGMAWSKLCLKMHIPSKKNLESLKIRGVLMNESGDSPPLYIWDVSTLYSWNQKQVKSFYQYLPSSLHSWQCFVTATRLVFCILNQKRKNIDCPNLHKAADL